jgi:two-component system cell cycle response regulator
MAARVRRLIWHRHMSQQVEQSVSDHLKLALIDPLTGLYNRRYAERYLDQMVRQSRAGGSTVTAMIVDLDRFKAINDTFGHLTGDTVLQQTAKRLLHNLRAADLVARLGGEEFLILLNDTAMPEVRDIAERLRQEISNYSFMGQDGQSIRVSASIGVSAQQDCWASSQELIESADTALYLSKERGRNRVTFCDQAA